MSKADQLVADLDYLKSVGLTVEQLRSLHHWSATPTESNVTYASVREYFCRGRDMRENNSHFADRLHLVAETHKRGIPALVDLALRIHPIQSA